MFFLATELGMTIKELSSKLTQEELIHWVAFFELKKPPVAKPLFFRSSHPISEKPLFFKIKLILVKKCLSKTVSGFKINAYLDLTLDINLNLVNKAAEADISFFYDTWIGYDESIFFENLARSKSIYTRQKSFSSLINQ